MSDKPHKKTRRLLQYPRKDIVGNVYGRLTVVSFHGFIISSVNRRDSWWLCKCICGNTKIIRTLNLMSGTSSCGCLVTDNMLKVTKNNIGTKRPCKDETKDKIRKTLIETYKKHPEILENRKPSGINQYNGKYTSIEKLIADTLTLMNINFYHNQKVGRYFPDFLIFHDVIIECDGEYWHNEEKDLKRDSYLMDKGYYIFRLAGKRIKQDPKKCVSDIVGILHFLQHRHALTYELKN
jgi:very-short-patch-repair endonuclease